MQNTYLKKYSVSPFFEVQEDEQTGYKSLFAAQDLPAFTILLTIGYQKILDAPNMHSLQIGDNRHIELQPDYLQYTNHSCNPNVFFDTTRLEVISLRPIPVGEEINFLLSLY